MFGCQGSILPYSPLDHQYDRTLLFYYPEMSRINFFLGLPWQWHYQSTQNPNQSWRRCDDNINNNNSIDRMTEAYPVYFHI